MGTAVELDDELHDAIVRRQRGTETMVDTIRRLIGADPVDPRLTMTAVTAEVFEGVAAGLSTDALAARMFMSRQGIEYNVSLLLRRFRVSNRVELVARASALGVLVGGNWPPKVRPDYIRPRGRAGVVPGVLSKSG